MLMLAGEAHNARFWHADGVHGSAKGLARYRSMPVHSLREMAKARMMNADLVFLSPLYATSSHPGTRPLGPMAFARLARLAGDAKVIALGGMTRAHFLKWRKGTIHGWAAINAFRKMP
jgi:thiamine-phosphate pyrophosphorylase